MWALKYRQVLRGQRVWRLQRLRLIYAYDAVMTSAQGCVRCKSNSTRITTRPPPLLPTSCDALTSWANLSRFE